MRRRLMMEQNAINTREMVFSYTGTWTDSEMEINGALYRVLQLKSAGTLTFDSRMVNKGSFDVWAIGSGAKGSSSPTDTVVSTQSYYTCIQAGCNYHIPVSIQNYAVNTSNGADGGWAFGSSLWTKSETAVVTFGAGSAKLGDIFAESGYNRPGTRWFDIGTIGKGGTGSGYKSTNSAGTFVDCPNCGMRNWLTNGYSDTSSAGKCGMIAIRMRI